MRLLFKAVRWATYFAVCFTTLVLILGAASVYVDSRLTEFDRNICERQTACEDDACCAEYLGL